MNKLKNRCDICDTEVTYPKKCKLCGKKICHNCRVWYDVTGCERCIESYCIDCWEIGKPYRTEIEQLIIEHNNKLVKLEEEWINKVKQDLAQGDN